ncbi:thermonuclease family protein [Peredibacter starrii]|uniref:Thermonuclease family protein n=1 Tax=Peredibacter starrii TaxID=28202 RepID=A0AAX4HUX5_9BACT|nr:thermonuclease family protein [Peredibacter starrii]WPU67097.1 thermonuclease family protein [Peredibacter starrii]
MAKFIFILMLSVSAFARTDVKYLRNYDGDTITFDVGKVRVLGIDTAELKSRKPCEKEYGKVAQIFVEKELRAAKEIYLTNNNKRDIYGRILAKVHYDGKDLGEVLLREQLAVPYVPKKRQKVNWCKVQEKRNESKKL